MVAVLERFAIEYSLLNVRNAVKSKFLEVESRDPHQWKMGRQMGRMGEDVEMEGEK